MVTRVENCAWSKDTQKNSSHVFDHLSMRRTLEHDDPLAGADCVRASHFAVANACLLDLVCVASHLLTGELRPIIINLSADPNLCTAMFHKRGAVYQVIPSVRAARQSNQIPGSATMTGETVNQRSIPCLQSAVTYRSLRHWCSGNLLLAL